MKYRYHYISLTLSLFLISSIDYAQPNAIDPLKIQRTYAKDLFGYSQEEIDAAKKFLAEKLYPTRDMLQAKIKLLTDTLKEPLKEGYDKITLAELKQAQEQLKEWNEEIYNQEIIAGERSSTIRRVAKYAMATAALAGVVALGVSYYGGPEIPHERFST